MSQCLSIRYLLIEIVKILFAPVAVPNLAQATEVIDAEKLIDYTSYFPINFKNGVYVLTKYNLDDVMHADTLLNLLNVSTSGCFLVAVTSAPNPYQICATCRLESDRY